MNLSPTNSHIFWASNENDRFPDELFCYIKMSYDSATGIVIVYDVQYSTHKLDLK